MALSAERKYSEDEFCNMELPERCELINGSIYIGESIEKYSGGKIIGMSPAPNYFHQKIVMRVSSMIRFYIDRNKGDCEVFAAPADVRLDSGDTVQPDIFVTCDPNKIDGQNHNGAPDWIIEILSPSTAKRDAVDKLALYHKNGVREYWIIDPSERHILVYPLEENANVEVYTFDDTVISHIYKNTPAPFSVRLSDYV